MSKIEVYSECHDLLGESPRWHPLENRLYWVDIEGGLVHRQGPAGDQPELFDIGLKVGALAFDRAGDLILATSQGYQRWNEASGQLTPLVNPEADKPGARFNDGLVDAAGRFWAGTMTETDATSSLYRLDPDLSLHTMLNGITISNGIGWNRENTRLYFTDTNERTVWLYDFDLPTGSITNKRPFLQVEGTGLPDGLAVDMEGNVWCTLCGGGRIEVYNPNGSKIDELLFPTRCITACTFGGEDLSILFVTSSSLLLDPAELPGNPVAGCVFQAATRSHGLPDHLFG